MPTTRLEVDRQTKALATVSASAQKATARLWASLDQSNPDAAAKAFRSAFPAIVDQYGRMAAVLAGDFYDMTRDESAPRKAFRALLAPPPLDKAGGSAARIAGALFTDDPNGILSGLLREIDQLTKEPYRLTVSNSAAKDPAKPRYARVPRGSTTCEFCTMLAGRGFVYGSSREAGELNAYHGHCDCLPVASFEKRAALGGYNPAELDAQWRRMRAERQARIAERAAAERARTSGAARAASETP